MSEPVNLLRIRDVCARVGLCRTTIYDKMAAGSFPKPVYPAPGAPRWRSDTIAAYIEALGAPSEREAA